MQKTSLTNAVLARIGSKPVLSAQKLIALLIKCVFFVAAITFGGKALLHSIGNEHSASTARHRQIIGDNVFLVPQNVIHKMQDRRDGTVASLELYMHWPTLTGYTYAAQKAFNHASERREILFVSIAPDPYLEISPGRIYESYLELTNYAGSGPASLELRRFKEGDGGLTDEILVLGERAPEQAFIARCLTGEMAAMSLAPCERRLPFAKGLRLTYRFAEELLPEWLVLDEKILERLHAMLQTEI